MLKKLFLTAITFLVLLSLKAQNKVTLESKYIDIQTKNNLVYALSKTNKLVVWDMKTGNINYIKKNIACIYVDKNDNFYCSSTEGEVYKETIPNKWFKEFGFTGKPFAIFKTSSKRIASLSSKGIKYNNTYYMPAEKNRFGNGFYSYKNNKLRKPTLTYIDSKDRIWITYDYGKFTEVFIFDTQKSAFVINKILFIKDDKKTFNSREDYLNDYQKKQLKKYPYYVKKEDKNYSYKFPTELPLYFGIKSICQDKEGSYFFSEGLAHSHRKSGLFVYQKTKTNHFYSIVEHFEDSFKKKNEIFGPLAYNKYDDTLYFYSNYGFYKLIEKEGKLISELIVDPNILLYTKAIPHEYGNLMNVKKIVFLDKTRFAFLTLQYGFGYFDGENINLFN